MLFRSTCCAYGEDFFGLLSLLCHFYYYTGYKFRALLDISACSWQEKTTPTKMTTTHPIIATIDRDNRRVLLSGMISAACIHSPTG